MFWGTLTARVSAVAGTVLTGFPLLAPLVLGVIFAVGSGRFLFDFLIPGELFFVVVAGALLLVLATVILRRLRVAAGILTAATIVTFFATDLVSQATGLSDGRTASEGWPLFWVMSVYALYVLSVVGLFVLGILVCRVAFSRAERAVPSAVPPAERGLEPSGEGDGRPVT